MWQRFCDVFTAKYNWSMLRYTGQAHLHACAHQFMCQIMHISFQYFEVRHLNTLTKGAKAQLKPQTSTKCRAPSHGQPPKRLILASLMTLTAKEILNFTPRSIDWLFLTGGETPSRTAQPNAVHTH